MPLFPLDSFESQIALIDGDQFSVITYDQLQKSSIQFVNALSPKRSLVFFLCQNKIADLVAYIALINSPHVICLLDGKLPAEMVRQLIDLYQPGYIIHSHTAEWGGYAPLQTSIAGVYERKDPSLLPLHPDLKLLLTTSGSTASPKMVRLSSRNILSNAQAINQYLGIDSKERALLTLPFHYSYGLSVVHTHLLAGASIVVTQYNPLQKEFWDVFKKQSCTSLAGVPFTYEMFAKAELHKMDLPALKTMTQAGGRLDKHLVELFYEYMKSNNGRFFVMYGQTEATARMAYLPMEMLPGKSEAIGVAIPGGTLKIFKKNQEIAEPAIRGELVYEGPNVMMGYAEKGEDLAYGDHMLGVLHTGDLGYFDPQGVFYITGRTKRISKVYGTRINLDEIEAMLNFLGRVAVISNDETIFFFIEKGSDAQVQEGAAFLSERLKLHPATFKGSFMAEFPLTSSGKIDYVRLQEMV